MPTWTKWNEGLAWPQLMIDCAIASLQKSLQFRYKFGAFMDPQLKFLPSGTMSKVCKRISISPSTWWCDICADVWRSGSNEGSFTGISGLRAFTLDSAGKTPLPASSRCAVELGLGVIPAASLDWLFLEDKSLLSVASSRDTWKKIKLAIQNALQKSGFMHIQQRDQMLHLRCVSPAQQGPSKRTYLEYLSQQMSQKTTVILNY